MDTWLVPGWLQFKNLHIKHLGMEWEGNMAEDSHMLAQYVPDAFHSSHAFIHPLG